MNYAENTLEMNKTLDAIGLETTYATELRISLNELLANYQVFYMNLRGFHWNITGRKFFELHVKFEELYNNLHAKIDEIAERILTIGGTPIHAFSDYLELSEIEEQKNIFDADETVQSLLDSFKVLLVQQRQILEISGNANDEGTNSLMSDYIREQEKLVWMYSAFMKDR